MSSNPLKRLASQTAVYGLSSIVGRLLNYLLVPLYTRVLVTGDYGIYTEMYAWVSILWVVLTYGMETTFFRFAQSESDSPKVFSTAFTSLLFTSLLFLLVAGGNAGSIARSMGYGDHIDYIVYFAFILSLDALAAIPFARLRQQNRPIRFAVIKLINIGLNIGFNLFFILLCPYLLSHYPDTSVARFVLLFFDPTDLVSYIFISNLISTVVTLLLLLPDVRFRWSDFDFSLLKRMLVYTWPLLIVAIAGSINLSIDKILLAWLLPGDPDWVMSQVGIYGACYKVSIIMTLFVQTFRYAADPFFFAESAHNDSLKIYAEVLKIFTVIVSLIFLVTTLYLDLVILFIGEPYRAGRDVIPILLMGNLFLGIFYNLSFWYKLTNRTIYGALLSIIGSGITITLNLTLIPSFGYYGSAWAAFFAYLTMMVLSYVLSRRSFPVPYENKRILLYLLLPVAIYLLSRYLPLEPGLLKYFINTLLLFVFVATVFYLERKSLLKLIHQRKG
ncbi:MAG TPA: oligosaccharide flippase family protein [Bacteroidales bacterium]|nr:oligosaccharide flippase family protein [Bacteroidales bacterium]